MSLLQRPRGLGDVAGAMELAREATCAYVVSAVKSGDFRSKLEGDVGSLYPKFVGKLRLYRSAGKNSTPAEDWHYWPTRKSVEEEMASVFQGAVEYMLEDGYLTNGKGGLSATYKGHGLLRRVSGSGCVDVLRESMLYRYLVGYKVLDCVVLGRMDAPMTEVWERMKSRFAEHGADAKFTRPDLDDGSKVATTQMMSIFESCGIVENVGKRVQPCGFEVKSSKRTKDRRRKRSTDVKEFNLYSFGPTIRDLSAERVLSLGYNDALKLGGRRYTKPG